MKKLYIRQLIIISVLIWMLLGNAEKAKATHAMGADLSYSCLDTANHVYLVTLHFYRDCAGIPAPDVVTLYVNSSCAASFTTTLNQVPCSPNTSGGQPCEVSPLCPTFIGESTCNGGNLPGVEAFDYTAIVTLPVTCTDWTFSISIGSRNNAITNLQDPGGQDLYVQAILNNQLVAQDNSPVFTTLPVPFICVNQPFSYNHGGLDADGDSLAYSLVNPLGAGAVPIPYNSVYSPTNPMSTSGPFGFNTLDGQMNFTPNQLQVAVVTVLVQEFRNGQLIGSTMRDMEFVVVNLPGCASPAPGFSELIQNTLQGGFFIDSNVVQVCPGSELSFLTSAYTIPADSIFITSNISQAIPAAQFVSTYIRADSVIGAFAWQTSPNDTGRHTFIITVKNNNCPLVSSQAYAITIDVLTGTYAGPDVSYCPAGGPVQLHAIGGTQFSWAPSTGLSNPSISSPTAAPIQTTSYVVTSNLSSNCKNVDTVVVSRVPNFNFNLTPAKDTICLYGLVTFNITPDSTQGPYTYQWSPTSGLNFGNIPNPIADPLQTTNYSVIIKSLSTGCTEKDSAKIVVKGVGPQVMLSADKTKVCAGDTIHLSTFISTVTCGISATPCNGNSSNLTAGTDSIVDVTGATPYDGFYSSGRIQILYQASELKAIGMKPGTITAIAFNVAYHDTLNSLPYYNFTIQMGCTENTQLNTFVPGLSQVMYSNPLIITGTGWQTHVLDSPYNWDGISNLIIEVCFTSINGADWDLVYANNTGYSSVVFAAMNDDLGCNLSGAVTPVGTSSNRPNTIFTYCAAPLPIITHQWTPTTNLFVPDSLDPYVILEQNSTYILSVADSNCQGGSEVQLQVDSSFGISTVPDVPYCNGTPAQLNVSLTGTPPLIDLTCGLNGPPCTGNPVLHSLILPGAFASQNTPFIGDSLGDFADARTQILYLASELQNVGFTKGTLSQIGLKIDAKNSSRPYMNLNISLGCTNKFQLDDNGWESTNLVYNSASYNTVAGWNDFALQNTFDWDGVSNLVVEICWNNPDSLYQSGSDLTSNQTVVYNALHIGATTGLPGCVIPVPTLALFNELPEMRAQICPAPVVPITYVWTPVAGLTGDSTAHPYASPAQTTVYHVTAYFGGRCPKTSEVDVTIGTLTVNISADTTVCNSAPVQLFVFGGNSYIWQSASGGLSCTTCPNPIATPVASTNIYYVQVSDSTTGCIVTDSVIVNDFNLSVVPLFADTTIQGGDSVTLGVIVSGATGPYAYLWSPSTYLDSINAASPISKPLAPIVYTVSVTSGPCVDTADIKINAEFQDSLIMPLAFAPSPESPAVNQTFGPVLSTTFGTPTIKAFRIYNRWGQLIHNSNEYWDGKFDNKEQPVGTYIYYIEVQYPNSSNTSGMLTFKKQGSVTLLR